MKAEDLRAKSEDELKKELLDLKKQQFNLRFQLSQGQLANTAQLRTVRRNVARVLTVLSQKTSGVEVNAAPKKQTKKAAAKKTAAKKTTKAKSSKDDKAA